MARQRYPRDWRGGGVSTDGLGIESWGSGARLDEVTEDPANLLRVRDDGEDSHLGRTTRAAQGVDFVDLRDQPRPRCARLLGGDRPIGWVLVGLTEAEGGLLLVLQSPSFGGQADEVGLA